MTLVERIHRDYVVERRVRVLAGHLAPRITHGASVLDVGCGDGRIAQVLATGRPDLRLIGVDVLVRPDAAIPVQAFDGLHLPFADRSVDVVLLIDVLHHAHDPRAVLRDAARVARRGILIKDHLTDRPLAARTLRFMDRIGNARHGVALPYAYFSRRQWREAFVAVDLQLIDWREDLGLYPWPASMLFDGALHFIAQLSPSHAP